ncbi:MAG: NifU family protein [Bdellovibrionales bacterium]
MFIQTEETPNPTTLKFLPGMVVKADGTLEACDEAEAAASPLAQTLLSIDGVSRVLLGYDFISVTKSADLEWKLLKPRIVAAIMDYFVTAPISSETPPDATSPHAAPLGPDDEDFDIVKQICDILDSKVRPGLARDGGDIAFVKYQDGIVWLRLKGACAGCPSSTLTLKAGVENLLCSYVPEIVEVREAEDDRDPDSLQP